MRLLLENMEKHKVLTELIYVCYEVKVDNSLARKIDEDRGTNAQEKAIKRCLLDVLLNTFDAT